MIETSEQPKPRSSYINMILPGAIVAAAIVISASLFLTRTQGTANIYAPTPTNDKPVAVVVDDDDHILGNVNAKVTILEFSDFQCPFCRQFFEQSFSQIKSEYVDTGKVRIVYKHMPLSFHPAAQPAAVAAECAGAQGMFWEMHDVIFEQQAKSGTGTIQFTESDLKKWAATLKLNTTTFNQCLSSDVYDAAIKKDNDYALSLGLNGTPSFIINGNKVVGAQPFEVFKSVIEAEL